MNHTEHTRAGDGGFGRKGTLRLPVRVLLSTLFLLTSFPIGLFWFVVLVVLLLAGISLTIVWVGLPILALAMLACALGASAERWRLGALLGNRLSFPYRPLPRGSALARVRARAADPALWRGLLYLVLLLPIGLVELVVVLVLAFSAVLVSYPLWLGTLPEGRGVTWTGVFVADTAPEALLVALVGLVVMAAAAAFVPQVSRAHAALGLALLGPRRHETLDERVEELTEGRSKTVEAAIAERRRIERYLHDGAQQRLVSLAMALGMARQKLEGSPGGATAGNPEVAELVREAHEEAKRALAEMRDLIRGIHPAVLTDRGLDAAVSALAGRSPVPTSVEVELDERPPEAAEITAYFMIAEALANVAKHSGASEARVWVRREKGSHAGNGERPADLLVSEVEDDGRGGADPAGDGLKGLADRALVLDGRLAVESQAARPGCEPSCLGKEAEKVGEGTSDKPPLKVAIAEDSGLLRAGIARLITDAGHRVVAEASDGPGFLRIIEERPPDVAVVDVRMPPGFKDEGLKAAMEARRRWSGLAVLVLSQYVEERYGRELLESGMEGTGYLLKDRVADVAEFVSALETVASGGTVLDPEVVGQLLARRRRNEGLASLTPREREVLALGDEGRTNQAIAKRLFVTGGAVEKHVRSIFGKLGLPHGEADHRRVLAVLAYLRG